MPSCMVSCMTKAGITLPTKPLLAQGNSAVKLPVQPPTVKTKRLSKLYGVTPADVEREREMLAVWGHLTPEVSEEALNRKQRQTRIAQALAVDDVLTVTQLQRYFQADEEDLEVLCRAKHLIEPVHMRSTLIQAEFVGLTVDTVSRRATVLAHQAATAQARLQLVIPPERWRNIKGVKDADNIEPDAMFFTESGKRIAVEYDRGTYPMKKVTAKLLSFARDFDGTLWVVPPPLLTRSGKPMQRARSRFLEQQIALSPELRNVKKSTHIMVADWWRGCEVIRE